MISRPKEGLKMILIIHLFTGIKTIRCRKLPGNKMTEILAGADKSKKLMNPVLDIQASKNTPTSELKNCHYHTKVQRMKINIHQG